MGFKVENFVKNLLKFGCEAWGFENTFAKAGTNFSEKKAAQIAIVTIEMKVEYTNTSLRGLHFSISNLDGSSKKD